MVMVSDLPANALVIVVGVVMTAFCGMGPTGYCVVLVMVIVSDLPANALVTLTLTLTMSP